MAQAIVISSIGSASRDFATVTLWEASLPANFTTGDGRMEFGQMFADIVFTESLNVGFTGITMDRVNRAVLENAPGESPIWQPNAAIGPTGAVNFEKAPIIQGITFDGSDVPGTATIYSIRQGQGGQTNRCTFRNGPGIGANPNNTISQFCLYHDNADHGTVYTVASGGAPYICCGFVRNGKVTGGDGAKATSTGKLRPLGSWSLGNIGKSFSGIENSILTGFCAVDDTVFTDESITQVGLLESQVIANLRFADFDGSNFQLKTDSTLRLIGVPTARFGPLPFDLLNRFVSTPLGDQYDMGPFQGPAPDLKTGGRLFVTGII